MYTDTRLHWTQQSRKRNIDKVVSMLGEYAVPIEPMQYNDLINRIQIRCGCTDKKAREYYTLALKQIGQTVVDDYIKNAE